jgi:2'-5' RNA ligase
VHRYFFALWPDDEVRGQLDAVSKRLPDGCGRRVRTENLHITLVFLGHVDEAVLERISREVDGIHAAGTELKLDASGWWKKPQVIWLGAGSVPEPLVHLVARLNTVAGANGMRIDCRPYTPHLTLVRKAKRPLQQFSFPPIHWKIMDFCLVESVTHASGVEYLRRHNWPLTSS